MRAIAPVSYFHYVFGYVHELNQIFHLTKFLFVKIT